VRVLFILKRSSYGYSCGDKAGGLLNSCRFIVEMLRDAGLHSKIAVVTDNNDIDREVTLYRPDVCIIEALWVVPEKFDILSRLHPNVKFVVRIHSDLPFLANDGIAFSWIFGYIARGVFVAANKARTVRDLIKLTSSDNILFMPNFYPITKHHFTRSYDPDLNIGCFGAIRPLKNQLAQAVAAIEYANGAGRTLFFHMNGTRQEQGGERTLKNIRALFYATRHVLVLHPWLHHHEFLRLMKRMDLSMSVSFSETFCITAADAVAVSTPLVCSDQVPFADSRSIVTDPTDTNEIRDRIASMLRWPWLANLLNLRNLRRFSRDSRKVWISVLDEIAGDGVNSST
jgi:hypothetical protein